jgi:hypothetical protein
MSVHGYVYTQEYACHDCMHTGTYTHNQRRLEVLPSAAHTRRGDSKCATMKMRYKSLEKVTQ